MQMKRSGSPLRGRATAGHWWTCEQRWAPFTNGRAVLFLGLGGAGALIPSGRLDRSAISQKGNPRSAHYRTEANQRTGATVASRAPPAARQVPDAPARPPRPALKRSARAHFPARYKDSPSPALSLSLLLSSLQPNQFRQLQALRLRSPTLFYPTTNALSAPTSKTTTFSPPFLRKFLYQNSQNAVLSCYDCPPRWCRRRPGHRLHH